MKQKILKFSLLAGFIFFLSIFTGITSVANSSSLSEKSEPQLSENFGLESDAGLYKVFVYIFFNNALINLASIISFFTFGLAPLYILLANGYMVGKVSAIFSNREGIWNTVAIFSPHGIIEIPALIMSAGLGILMGMAFLKYILGNNAFENDFKYAIRIYFSVIVPMNLAAAFIEVYVTPYAFYWLQR